MELFGCKRLFSKFSNKKNPIPRCPALAGEPASYARFPVPKKEPHKMTHLQTKRTKDQTLSTSRAKKILLCVVVVPPPEKNPTPEPQDFDSCPSRREDSERRNKTKAGAHTRFPKRRCRRTPARFVPVTPVILQLAAAGRGAAGTRGFAGSLRNNN